jgi:DNA modification methylase
MGKAWDNSGIAYDVTVWQQCLRVLKPGGHLVAFGGSRTYHRLAVAIEDAGFEIRDQIQWIYGSGFPKSLDVSKAMDKQNGDNQLSRRLRFTEWVRSTGLTASQIDKATGTFMGSHYTTSASQPAIMTRAHLDAVRHLIDTVPDWVEAEVDIRTTESEAWKSRPVVTKTGEDMFGEYEVDVTQKMTDTSIASPGIPLQQYAAKHDITITAPSTDLAKQWQGWGTALKPAHEPAVLARKPLCGTVADNVMTWGVGALNIDGCRVESSDAQYTDGKGNGTPKQSGSIYGFASYEQLHTRAHPNTSGRWPANVILDEDAAVALDAQSGGNVSRFFYTVPNEYLCPLCYNTYAKDITAEGICKNIIANNAEKRGWTTPATNAFIAHVIALLRQNAQLAQNAKSAIPQCDLCATSIAVALAAIKTLGFNQQKCELILAYMPKFASSILIQNLVSFAELWGNIDTTPTTQNLLMLYGSALHAIENYTKQEGKEKVVGGNDPAKATRFLYTAKASKAEREAGLDGVAMQSNHINAPRENEDAKHATQRANHHPTVKPLSLMRHLVRLVTPPGGKVLDPFMGSGSTGCAAVLEGFDFVGIDITPEYVAIAQKRIDHYAVTSPLMNL